MQETFFSDTLSRSATLRLLRYPHTPAESLPLTAAGEHTDYDNLTLLAVKEGAPGLQVWKAFSRFIDYSF